MFIYRIIGRYKQFENYPQKKIPRLRGKSLGRESGKGILLRPKKYVDQERECEFITEL